MDTKSKQIILKFIKNQIQNSDIYKNENIFKSFLFFSKSILYSFIIYSTKVILNRLTDEP